MASSQDKPAESDEADRDDESVDGESVDNVRADEARLPDPPAGSPQPSMALVAGAGVAGTFIVALVALAIVLVVLIVRQPDAAPVNTKATFNSLEQGGLLAARQEVLKLITLSPSTAKAQIKSLTDDATGSFRDSLAQIATPLATAVVQQKVTTTGSISQAGVVTSSATAKTVTVLVAASSEVRNESVPTGQPRTYRLMVKMQLVNSHYLVADMQFVP